MTFQVEINGKEVTVAKGSTVMDAAHEAGTYIPHFCYHKKLSIAANCRMCLVEVEKMPKPVPACATPVSDGMKVHTDSEIARNAQKGVMEFLLINHPLDCPICDQGGECQLQDLAVGYGNGESRYTEAKRVVEPKEMGPLISTKEMNRCIHCTRCVRFTEEIAGYQEIGMANRNQHSEILPFIGRVVETELSGNVIDLCPVGALTSKPFRYSARSWELSRRKSISAHDALGSNLIVQVKDHQIKRVLPLGNEEINECWLSDRDRFAYEGLNSPDRLARPMIKQDNQWIEVEWETALNYVVKGLKGVSADHGKDALAAYINGSNTLEEVYLAYKLADEFGIKNIDSNLRSQDESATLNSSRWLGQSLTDLLTNDCVFVVGSTLRMEQPLLTARIRAAVKNKGMKLNILSAAKEDLHIPAVAQFAEHPLLWANFLSDVLEKTKLLKSGQSVDTKIDTGALAKALLDSDKGTILLGALAQNHPNYAQIASISAQISKEANIVMGFLPQKANSVGAEAVQISFNQKMIGASFTNKEQKAYFLVNVDPKNDFSHNANILTSLQKAETVIAFTSFKDETLLQYADVLLPSAPFTETAGSFVNMEGKIQSFHGVVRPFGETRPLWKILRVLGNMLELSHFDYNTIDEVRAECLEQISLQEKLSQLPVVDEMNKLSENTETALFRVGDIGLYETDAIVRRASALQTTKQAMIPSAYLHPITLEALGFKNEEKVLAKQDGGTPIEVTVVSDERLAQNTVYLIHHATTNTLGNLLGQIKLEGIN